MNQAILFLVVIMFAPIQSYCDKNVVSEPENKKGIKYLIVEEYLFSDLILENPYKKSTKEFNEDGKLVHLFEEYKNRPDSDIRIYYNSGAVIDSTIKFKYSEGRIHVAERYSKAKTLFREDGLVKQKIREILMDIEWKNEVMRYFETTVYQYDDKSQLTSVKIFNKYNDGSGGLEESTQYTYHDTLLLEKSVFNQNLNRTTDRELYMYYDGGQLKNKKLIYMDEIKEEYEYEYYSNGALKTESNHNYKYYTTSPTDIWATEINYFDDEGNKTENKGIYPDDPEGNYRTKYVYRDGVLIESIYTTNNKTNVTKYETTFSNAGNLIMEKVIYASGDTDVINYVYDEKGRLKEKKNYFTNSEDKLELGSMEKYYYIDY